MSNRQTPKQPNEYARWSSLSFQLIGIIMIMVLAGRYFDKHFSFSNPFLTVGGAITGTCISFYLLIREAGKK